MRAIAEDIHHQHHVPVPVPMGACVVVACMVISNNMHVYIVVVASVHRRFEPLTFAIRATLVDATSHANTKPNAHALCPHTDWPAGHMPHPSESPMSAERQRGQLENEDERYLSDNSRHDYHSTFTLIISSSI